MIDKTKTPLSMGRPKKEAADGREPYSTVLQPHLVKWLKHYAIETKQTPADVLEIALSLYKHEKERNK